MLVPEARKLFVVCNFVLPLLGRGFAEY
jgi:hypothetical protein